MIPKSKQIFITCAVLVLIAPISADSQVAKRNQPYPRFDHPPSGELLMTGGRSVLPEGFVLRSVYTRGVTFTKSAESWVPNLYNDAADYCTIGYGHLIKKARCDGTELSEFRNGITKERGGEILSSDLGSSEYTVMTKVTIPLTDGQFAALTDFVFNVGSGNFNNSTLLQVINAKQLGRVPDQFRRWVIAGGRPLPGLKSRREGELNLFFDGLPKPKSAPTSDEDLSPIDIRNGEAKKQ